MLFASEVFIFAFLPAIILLYYTLCRRSRTAQNVLLTIASLFFYAWGEPKFVLIMLAVITANYLFALWIDRIRENRRYAQTVIGLMLAVNLTVFFIFKYLVFTVSNINSIFGADIGVPDIALPIGISFFMFQAISYVIDVYRQKGCVQKNLLNVMLYISFFPQLIAGPIVRYETIADQIHNRKESLEDFADGCCRFIVGLGKKTLLANTLALAADAAFAAEERSVVFAWTGALAYSFQIYFDFSGYSDMALGLGKMFGFHFLENFDYPYISRSISEFWRRWHISLGSWFRDYVYFPLGGSRNVTKGRLVLNLFAVWFLTGLWHGANWTFIVWGLMYFALITLEKLTGFSKKLGAFGHVYTLLFVVLGWVLFRADSISHAAGYMAGMFGLAGNRFFDATAGFYLNENAFYLIAAVLFSIPTARFVREKFGNTKAAAVLYPIALTLLFILSVSFIIKGSYNPFIYFNF